MDVREVLNTLQGFMDRITPAMNQIVIFFLILFIGFLVGKILSRLAQRLLRDLESDAWAQRLGARFSVSRLVSGIVAGVIYVITVIVALDSVGLSTVVLTALTIVVALSAMLGIIVAVRDLVPNVMAGLTIRRRFTVGAKLRIEGVEGRIVELTAVDTTIETKKGERMVIPNGLFLRKPYVGGRK